MVADHQRTEPTGEDAGAVDPAAHEQLLTEVRTLLHPSARAHAGLVRAVEALGDDALEPMLLDERQDRSGRADAGRPV